MVWEIIISLLPKWVKIWYNILLHSITEGYYMAELYLLIAFTISGYAALAYLGTGLALKEFKGVNLPLITTIYDASLIKPDKLKTGKWIDYRGNRMCSACKTVLTDEEWAGIGNRKDRCPKCGSRNKML